MVLFRDKPEYAAFIKTREVSKRSFYDFLSSPLLHLKGEVLEYSMN